MVGPQAEVGKDGEQVVENSPLHGLVGHPVGLPGEAVDLDRDAFRGGLEHPDHLHQVGVDARVALQVTRGVLPQGVEVDDGISSDRLMRRPPLSHMPRQFWNESLTSA